MRSCEPLKLGVHAAALGLAAVMGAYNAAAWMTRRDAHLAINTFLYTAMILWEQKHVAHHQALLARKRAPAPPTASPGDLESVKSIAA
jgi:hypothetical protein